MNERERSSPAGDLKFICDRCGALHDLTDLSLGADAPSHLEALSAAERAASELGEETCVLRAGDEVHRFLRALLPIPIEGTDVAFSWGVWVSLGERSFEEVLCHWEDPARGERGPYFGWLCTSVPGYPDTMHLKTSVSQQPLGLRPLVTLEPTDHPLAVHQREGIPAERLRAIVTEALHLP